MTQRTDLAATTARVIERLRAESFPSTDLAHAFVRAWLGAGSGPGPREPAAERAAPAAEAAWAFHAAPPGTPGRVRVETAPAPTLVPGSAVLRTTSRDVRFLLDSLQQTVEARGVRIRQVLHPVVNVVRDEATGAIRALERATEGAPGVRESWIDLELDPVSAELARELEAAAEGVLAAAHAVVGDFAAMRQRLAAAAEEMGATTEHPPAGSGAHEPGEVAAFLRWLADASFVLLGARSYVVEDIAGAPAVRVVAGSGLGLLRDEKRSTFASPVALASLPAELRARIAMPRRLVVDKTNRPSPLHRLVPMDDVGVRFFRDGRPWREDRFVGLFTRKAIAELPTQVPLLRAKHRAVLAEAGILEGTYDARELTSIFNSLPKEELFLLDPSALLAGIRALEQSFAAQEVQLVTRPSLSGRLVTVGIAIPERQWAYTAVERVVALVESRLGHRILERRESSGKPGFRQLYLYGINDPSRPLDARALEDDARELLEPWEERLVDRLATEDAARWREAFPSAYRDAVPPSRAARDVALFERLERGDTFAVAAVHPGDPDGGDPVATQLRIAQTHDMTLGALMPILRNLALDVLDEAHYPITPAGGAVRDLDVFRVRALGGGPLDPHTVDRVVVPGLEHILAERAEDDAMNGLLTAASLDWNQVRVLRAYVHHAFQLGLLPSRPSAATSLARAPEAARLLVTWFERRFDPARASGERERLDRELAAEAQQAIEAIADAADYRVLRALCELVGATVRTNHFRPADRRSRALALKIEPARVGGVPRPVPAHEIFVQGRGVEGVHLRGGDVARGGLRASDRVDDFRTEVLGLMKTQMVKNAIIVPVGAKGGFVLTQPVADRAQLEPRTREAYEVFVRALLDVTDDREADAVVPPEGVVRLDGDDPYLVVAADKGTARYSDLANGLAAAAGFWLDDAFASGGSRGYDHKALGITARGAWECGKEHFRKLGVDPERDPITVVGVGDLSGDVFGNGMLLSRTMRLLGAFNHRHVFLDPDPDPARSYAERVRCFQAVLGWDGYDPAAISAGGGVWLRAARAIPVPPGLREILGTTATQVSGDEMVRLLLRARVDLLYNGGIGTYVKASSEVHAEVDDKGNDAVRVDARDLRARVVVEGGNLGFTAAARSEYALAGGLVHTDAIDNSGGVDCSDHEVNVKIALATARRRGAIDRAGEDAALREATEEVCQQVLDDNRAQSLVLAVDERRSRDHFDRYRDLIGRLAAAGVLDPVTEGFGDDADLRAQAAEGKGFALPQLAVLLACEKLRLRAALVASDLVDRPALARFLVGYFPRAVRERIERELVHHPLRREIVATQVANHVVNTSGMAFVSELELETGASAADVVGAKLTVDRVTDADAVRAALVGSRASFAADVLYGALRRVEAVLGAMVQGNVRRRQALVPDDDAIAALRARAEVHAERVASALALDATASTVPAAPEGLPADVRAQVERIERLRSIFVVDALARGAGIAPLDALETWLEVGHVLRVLDIERERLRVPLRGQWDRIADRQLAYDLEAGRMRITRAMLARGGPGTGEGDVARRLAATGSWFERYQASLDRLRAVAGPTNFHGVLTVQRALHEVATALTVPVA